MNLSQLVSRLVQLNRSFYDRLGDMLLFGAPSECGGLIAASHTRERAELLVEAGLTENELAQLLSSRVSDRWVYLAGLLPGDVDAAERAFDEALRRSIQSRLDTYDEALDRLHSTFDRMIDRSATFDDFRQAHEALARVYSSIGPDDRVCPQCGSEGILPDGRGCLLCSDREGRDELISGESLAEQRDAYGLESFIPDGPEDLG